MQKVVIENVKNGRRKQVTLQSWNLLAIDKGQADVRKGWRLIGPYSGRESLGAAASTAVHSPQPTFIPDEIRAATEKAHHAEVVQESAMISGEAPNEPLAAPPLPNAPAEAPAATPVAPDPLTAPPDPVPPAPAPMPPPKAPVVPATAAPQALTALNGVTARVVELLGTMGITNYAQLAKANITDINKMLDANNLAAKKAQVPGWKMKATERSNA